MAGRSLSMRSTMVSVENMRLVSADQVGSVSSGSISSSEYSTTRPLSNSSWIRIKRLFASIADIDTRQRMGALQFFGMRCKECRVGHVQVNNLSRKYETELRAVSDALLLPKLELGILHTLHDEGEAVRPGFVAGELDCSYQLIGKRAKNLADRGLLKRSEDDQGRRLLEIEPSADAAYFSAERKESLEIPAGETEVDHH